MVRIDMPMPQNCDDCPMNIDCWNCAITKSFINLNTCEKERSPDCPLKEISPGHWTDKGSLSCRCDKCGCKSPKEYSYCPNCGMPMEKAHDACNHLEREQNESDN